MSAKEQGLPVFPVSPDMDSEIHNGKWGSLGMTLRQHYAGLAMQGILAGYGLSLEVTTREIEIAATSSVEFADALLAALAKEPQP